MEAVEANYPLESIVNELVKTEFQYEILTAKSVKRIERKLEHYNILRSEMIQRHRQELKEMDEIIERYRKPMEIQQKAMKKKEEKLAELRGKLEGRTKAMVSLGSLPPPVNEIVSSDSEEERVENEIITGVKTYSMPR